jgi:hypothetical protein
MAETSPNKPGFVDMIAGVVVGAGVMIGLRVLFPEIHRAMGDLVTGGLAGVLAVLTMTLSRRLRAKGQ